MNLIFTGLVLSAVGLSLAGVGLLVLWLRGVDAVAFPGVGLLVATPVLVILLTVLELAVVIAAIIAARYRTGIEPIYMSL